MTTVADAMLALLIIGFVIGFILAFSMGANDVANAFGTSYGSKVLTFVQVCILASIFETLGSVLLGGKVSDTIAKGIADLDLFKDSIYELMYGYMSALVGASGWLLIATIFKLPVSGTHSIVGAVIGFTMVAHGPNGVKWMTLIKVVSSWFTSPLLAGGLSSIIFVAVKFLVLQKEKPLDAGCKLLPVLYGITFAVIAFMIIEEALSMLGVNLAIWAVVLAAIGAGLLCWLLTFLLVMPILRHKIEKRMEETRLTNAGTVVEPKTLGSRSHRVKRWFHKNSTLIRNHLSSLSLSNEKSNTTSSSSASTTSPIPNLPDENGHQNPVFLEAYVGIEGLDVPAPAPAPTPTSRPMSADSDIFLVPGSGSVVQRPRPSLDEATQTAGGDVTVPQELVVDVVESPEIRHLFSFIQVITATFASFSHGANDVSNAVGPIVGMYQIYQHHEIASESRPEWWILLFGGVAMSVGLWSLGKKVMATIGDDLAAISPATGFCMELGTALTVLIASHLGVPISTTHCLVGSVICVSLVRSRRGVDWKIVRNIAFSWLITVPASALISAACMAGVRAIFKATNTFQYWDYFYPTNTTTSTTTMALPASFFKQW